MIARCEQCGKLYATAPKRYSVAKHHFCSRECRYKAQEKRYTVYNNYTDYPVVVFGTVKECAEAMGITPKSFYAIRSKSNRGIDKKWTVIDEKEDDDD